MRRRDFLTGAVGLGSLAGLAACGGTSKTASSTNTNGPIEGDVQLTFQQFGSSKIQANFLAGVVQKFEAANPKAKVKLQPIVASENDYYTKLELAMRSPRTAPDLVYEDTFLINSDIAAGYLTPLDDRLSAWSDWEQFQPKAKAAAQGLDGKTYGVPDGTDCRALWYNKQIFAAAGLPTTWQPKSWADIMTAAQTIKAKAPGVIPLNVYVGTGVGEAASMQGFEMLLYGTPNGTLFDKASQKWVVGSQGFVDALSFVENVYQNGLGPTPEQALAPTWGNTVSQELLPKGKLAINLDGSWLSGNWLSGGAAPWSQWHEVMGNAYMPTQNGQGSGKITMSGGWTWAIPKNAQNPNAAWALIKLLTAKDGEVNYDINAVQIPVRKDVAADESYIKANPTNSFFSDLVADTIYRPAYPAYSKISLVIQEVTGKVATNSSTPAQGAAAYESGVKQIVTDAKTTTL